MEDTNMIPQKDCPAVRPGCQERPGMPCSSAGNRWPAARLLQTYCYERGVDLSMFAMRRKNRSLGIRVSSKQYGAIPVIDPGQGQMPFKGPFLSQSAVQGISSIVAY